MDQATLPLQQEPGLQWGLDVRVQVSAVAYDNPIPGFQTNNTINLRLWAAKPDREFDLQAFNTGDYVQVWLPQPRPRRGCMLHRVSARHF